MSSFEEETAQQHPGGPGGNPNKSANRSEAHNSNSRKNDLERMFASLHDELARGCLTFEVALEWVVQEAAAVTGANGAALALPTADGAITCRATMGNAPEVGVVIRPGGGLSGQCIRTKQTVYAADLEADPRVERSAARELGACSVLIVPVLEGSRLLGILEVFSVRTNAFGPDAQAQLRHMAALLGPVLAGGEATSPTEQPGTIVEEESAASRDSLNHLRQQLSDPLREQKARRLPLVIALIAALVLIALLALWPLYSRQSGLTVQPARPPALVESADTEVTVTRIRPTRPYLSGEHAGMDCQSARQWMELAAGRGHVAAQYELARGRRPCASSNSSESAKWLEMAARNGHVIAQREYAALLADRKDRNPVQAYAWYVVAHQAGDAMSGEALKRLTPHLSDADIKQVRAQLGYMYAHGIGTPRDPVTAYVWLLLGTNSQGPLAREVATQMTPEQVATARKRATDWLRRRSLAPQSANLMQGGGTVRSSVENARLRDIRNQP